MEEGNTLVNALIGAVIGTVIGSFVGPFAPMVGGGVAGYLQGGTRNDGLRVGGIAGLFMLVPGALVLAVLAPLFGFIFLGTGDAAFGVVGILFGLVLAVVGLVFWVGMGAAGGYLGNYVKYDTDIDV